MRVIHHRIVREHILQNVAPIVAARPVPESEAVVVIPQHRLTVGLAGVEIIERTERGLIERSGDELILPAPRKRQRARRHECHAQFEVCMMVHRRSPGCDVAVCKPAALAVEVIHRGWRSIRPRVRSRRRRDGRTVSALHACGHARFLALNRERREDEPIGEIRKIAVHGFSKGHRSRIGAADSAIVAVIHAVADYVEVVARVVLLLWRHPVVEQVIHDGEVVELLRVGKVRRQAARLHRQFHLRRGGSQLCQVTKPVLRGQGHGALRKRWISAHPSDVGGGEQRIGEVAVRAAPEEIRAADRGCIRSVKRLHRGGEISRIVAAVRISYEHPSVVIQHRSSFVEVSIQR